MQAQKIGSLNRRKPFRLLQGPWHCKPTVWKANL